MTEAGLLVRRTAAKWDTPLAHAVAIVESYDTRVTLRQLFYRLVSDGSLRNTQAEYKQLSAKTVNRIETCSCTAPFRGPLAPLVRMGGSQPRRVGLIQG